MNMRKKIERFEDLEVADSRKRKRDNFLSTIYSPLSTESGLALVMTLVISAIGLAIMAGLIYMITVGTQISGSQKRYKTANEAGIGGAAFSYEVIGARMTPSFTPPAFSMPALNVGGTNCLNSKLNTSTGTWPVVCNQAVAIDPTAQATYDWRFDLGAAPFPTYTVYAKIVDTVEGNSSGDEGLIKGGVISSNPGDVTVQSRPYLYTIEIDAENPNNVDERAKVSVLYQY
jgi:hypothetical protein